jgi:hypothetical protein
MAQHWRVRLGLAPDAQWKACGAGPRPCPKDGVYLAHENCPQTFTEKNRDRPSMLAALGVLGGDGADRDAMRRTLHK